LMDDGYLHRGMLPGIERKLDVKCDDCKSIDEATALMEKKEYDLLVIEPYVHNFLFNFEAMDEMKITPFVDKILLTIPEQNRQIHGFLSSVRDNGIKVLALTSQTGKALNKYGIKKDVHYDAHARVPLGIEKIAETVKDSLYC
ncbi:hypothetical protein ACFL1H_05875, partial [Nanoarchaeota archaeon]